jgi:integrase
MELSGVNLDLVVDKLVNTITDLRSKLFYKIIIETSCKISELSKIKVKDITPNKIKFNKRSVNISIDLKNQIVKFIEEQNLSSDSYLFVTRQSDSISTKRIRQIIQDASLKRIGFKIDSKDLRKYSIKSKLKSKTLKEVKKESGLKRLDKRKYVSKEQIIQLENNIQNTRNLLIFKLLLNNIKSSQIANLKVEDILSLNISRELIQALENYASSNRISFGEYLFKTPQKTHISKRMIYKIISGLGNVSQIRVNPRIINNTAIAAAISSKDSDNKLNALGIKSRAFYMHGGFSENE